MYLADAIRRRGFRKWYERQLIESHAWLVTCFLCMVLAAALMEEIRFRAPAWQPLLMAAAIIGCFVLGWIAWTRYKAQLEFAEHYAEGSSCAGCGAYARFEVTAEGAPDAAAGGRPWLRVRCRRCSNEWRIG